MNLSKNITVLDGITMNPGDLNWQELQELGNVTIYDSTSPEQMLERLKETEIAVVNKCVFSSELIQQLPHLKHICVTATGYNNIDIEAAKEHNISVSNVSNYSTTAVVQHVFALLLNILNKVQMHNDSVQTGEWTKRGIFSYNIIPVEELAGKKMGILGFGNIGQAVAKVANSFGMEVIVYQRSPRELPAYCKATTLKELFQESDVLSLHAPLNADSREIINTTSLQWMKASAILINTGRGPLIDENALAQALKNNEIRAAALDVLVDEPPHRENPLLGLNNCIITPHQAWSSVQARQRLLNGTIENIKACLLHQPRGIQ